MIDTVVSSGSENYAHWKAPKRAVSLDTPQPSTQDKATRLREKFTIIRNSRNADFFMRKKPKDVYLANKLNSETKGSQAFRLEYGPETPRQSIIDDMVTYLGEYRLQASETFYKLRFSKEEDGLHIRDMNRGVAMVDTAEKSIARGEKVNRRKAEHKALQREDELLAKAEDGDMLIQISPPGEATSEAGNYGFIFITKVEKINDENKILQKNAIRINNATIEQYNQALSAITGKEINHTTAEGLIADPHYLGKTISYPEVQAKLSQIFDFKPSTQERMRNEWIISKVKPYIHHFTDMVQSGTSTEEAYSFFEKIENMVLELKDSYTPATLRVSPQPVALSQSAIDDFNNRYNYRPPQVAGSCGLTGSGSSSLVSFTASPGFIEGGQDKYGSLTFECPHCHAKNKRAPGSLIEFCQNIRCKKSVRC